MSGFSKFQLELELTAILISGTHHFPRGASIATSLHKPGQLGKANSSHEAHQSKASRLRYIQQDSLLPPPPPPEEGLQSVALRSHVSHNRSVGHIWSVRGCDRLQTPVPPSLGQRNVQRRASAFGSPSTGPHASDCDSRGWCWWIFSCILDQQGEGAAWAGRRGGHLRQQLVRWWK